MPALETFLRRVRLPGVPGAPAAAGVPVDRARQLEAELAPVFALLEEAEETARDLMATAERDAARRRVEATDEARRIVGEAHAQAPVEQAQAAAALLAKAAEDRADRLDEARGESERIDRVAAQRTAAVVDAVVRSVIAMGEPAR